MEPGITPSVQPYLQVTESDSNDLTSDSAKKPSWRLGVGFYELVVCARKVVLVTLPGFRLRRELSIQSLFLFDTVASTVSENFTLGALTSIVLIVFGALHLAVMVRQLSKLVTTE